MKRGPDGEIREFERGDVVWGIDPFKQDSVSNPDSHRDDGRIAPRPWLVISTGSIPFHPEQYLCLTLTTRTWHDDSIPLTSDNWTDGGAPSNSAIMPWSITAIQHEFLDTTGELVARLDGTSDDETEDGYQGHLTEAVTTKATRRLVGYLDETFPT